MKNAKVPIEVSARHCHLAKPELQKLFGSDYELKKKRQLTQPSDFACEETITIKSNFHSIENVRVIGPLRNQTQIEISKTDAIFLGVDAPLRLSGDLKGSGAIKIVGPQGEIDLMEGLIVAQRHMHCSTDEAKKMKLKTGDSVCVGIKSERPVIFENVAIRVRDDYKLCLQLDTDEGNAAGINKVGEGYLVK